MTKKYHVFLSHNSRDKSTVEQIAQWLEDNAQLSVWLDNWNLIPGEPWQEEIEKALDESECCVVFFGADGMGPWQNEEMRSALDERVSRKTIRMVPVLLPGAVRPGQESKLPRFLRRLTWVRFGADVLDPGALHRLVSGIKGIMPGRHAEEVKADICPFRGLEVFREQDHKYFFGREAVVQRLMHKLETGRFLAVLGPSGCGKSSVVQAGLIPHLRGRALVTLFTPRERPLEELAFALRRCYPEAKKPPAAQLLKHLREPGESLHYFSREALEDTPKKNLVIVIDQFEEVFTQAGSEKERKNFIMAVLKAVEVSNGPVMVIITMRSDFIGKCAFYPDLNTYVNDYFFQVDSMSREELRRAIEEPARLVDIHFEEGLLDRILKDVKGAPCELPLLEHALLELYERRQGNRLTAPAYEDIGGIEGALVKRAEAEFKKLDNTQKDILRKMFVLRLIQPGEGTEDTRRRAAKDELTAVGEDSRAAENLLARWVNARLLTINHDSSRKQELVDVAHEALIRKWDKIQAWMAEGREEARLIGIVRQAASEWESAHRNPDYLFQGARLAQVEELLKTHTGDLTGPEKEFINAGIGLREWHIKEGEEKRRNELQAARDLAAARTKAVKRSRAVIVVILFSLILSIYFLYIARENEKTIRKQITMNYWVDSRHARDKGKDLDAMYLCAKALSLNPGGKLQQAMLLDMNSYWNLFPLLTIFQHEDAVRGGTFNHDGTRILTWSEDNVVRLWNAGTGKQDGQDLVFEGSILGAAFNQNGTRVLTLIKNNSVRLWDAGTGKQAGQDLVHEGSILGAAFNREGTRILTWSEDKTAQQWNAFTGDKIKRALRHKGVVREAAFNQDGTRILTWISDKIARLWDADTCEEIDEVVIEQELEGAVLNHNGKQILIWLKNFTARLWDVVTNTQTGPDLRHKGAIRGAIFNRDETRILTWSSDNTARLWYADTNIGKRIGPDLVHKEDVLGAAFNRDETRILTWSDDNTARLWDIHKGDKTRPKLELEGPVLGAAFNRNGTWILTWSEDKTVRQWDAHTGKQTGEPLVPGGTVLGAAFNRDGNRVLTWSKDNTVRLLNVNTGKQIQPGLKHNRCVQGAVFNLDGTRILTWTLNTVRRWDAHTGEKIEPDLKHKKWVHGAAFNQNGTRILTWSKDKIVQRWDAHTGEKIEPDLEHKSGSVCGAAFNRDGTRILTWGSDNTARLWDTHTGKQTGPNLVHKGVVFGAAFNRDETLILTCGSDNTARLWDVKTGKQIGRDFVHKEKVRGAAFNQDGTRILTWSLNTLRLFDIDVDRDFPREKIELQIKVLTGTAFDYDKKQVKFIDPGEWRKLKKEYMDFAGEHYKNCNYPHANVFARLFPEAVDRELQ